MSKKPEETEDKVPQTGAVKRDKGKFVGAYFPYELARILAEDAKSESRTVSKHLAHLILLGLYARGHDITKFSDVGPHTRDFIALKEMMEKEKVKRSAKG